MPTMDDGKLYEQKPDPRDDEARMKVVAILILILLAILAAVGIWHILLAISGAI